MPVSLTIEATKVPIGTRPCSASSSSHGTEDQHSKRPKSAFVRGIPRHGTFVKKKLEVNKLIVENTKPVHKPGLSFQDGKDSRNHCFRTVDSLEKSVETLIGEHGNLNQESGDSSNENVVQSDTETDTDPDSACSPPRAHVPQPMNVVISSHISPNLDIDDDHPDMDPEQGDDVPESSLNFEGNLRKMSSGFFETRLALITQADEDVVTSKSEDEAESSILETLRETPKPDSDEGIGNLSDESPIKDLVLGSRSSIVSSCTLSVEFTPEPQVEHESLLNGTQTPQGYSDILSVLKKLESEGPEGKILAVPSENAQTPKAQSQEPSGNDTTSKKINEFFSYLDNVEDTNGAIVEQGRAQSAVPLLQSNRSTINGISDLLKESPQKLSEKVIKLRFKVEDTERAVTVLRDALEHQRKISSSSANKFQKELEHRLAQQKEEYEATIKRHQTFIDQLIEDKRSLSERCDVLHLDLRNSDRKHQEAMKNMEQRHHAELRRVKSLQETSSKIKQDKWMDEKTRRIKEQTVRGLEPEIQRLMGRHTNEMADLENERDRLLMSQEKELHQRHVQHVRELKALWEEEQHETIQRERQMLIQRHNLQLNEIAEQHELEAQRLQEQLRRERERAIDDCQHFEAEANQVRKIANERAQGEVDRIKEVEENKRKTLVKKHAAELASIKEGESTEREEWERTCRHQYEANWVENEKKLSEKFECERETKIEAERKRLLDEMKSFKDQCKRDLEEKLSRMKSKQETEIKDIDSDNETLRKKVHTLRHQTAKLEEEAIVTQANFKQMEITINDLKKTNAQLESERDDVRQAVRGEFNSALEALSGERNSLLNQISDLRLAFTETKSQKQVMERNHKREMDREIETIHTRVKQAISKKDEQIQGLKENFANALEQIEHLESSLERHTKDRILGPAKKK